MAMFRQLLQPARDVQDHSTKNELENHHRHKRDRVRGH